MPSRPRLYWIPKRCHFGEKYHDRALHGISLMPRSSLPNRLRCRLNYPYLNLHLLSSYEQTVFDEKVESLRCAGTPGNILLRLFLLQMAKWVLQDAFGKFRVVEGRNGRTLELAV